jgi:hypothetical protein
MAGISASGKLPAGDGNGLVAIAQQLIDQALGNVPPKVHLCVCLVDCAKVNVNGDTHELTPVARIRRIEVIANDEDVEVLRTLMSRALDQRTGREALPYNLEQEIRGVVDGEAGAQAVADEQAAADPCGGPPINEGAAEQPPLPPGNETPDGDVDVSGWPDDPSSLADPDEPEAPKEDDES